MKIGLRKDILKLMFLVLPLHQGKLWQPYQHLLHNENNWNSIVFIVNKVLVQ